MGSKSKKPVLKGRVWHKLERYCNYKPHKLNLWFMSIHFPTCYFWYVVGVDASTGKARGAMDGKKFLFKRSAARYARKKGIGLAN